MDDIIYSLFVGNKAILSDVDRKTVLQGFRTSYSTAINMVEDGERQPTVDAALNALDARLGENEHEEEFTAGVFIPAYRGASDMGVDLQIKQFSEKGKTLNLVYTKVVCDTCKGTAYTECLGADNMDVDETSCKCCQTRGWLWARKWEDLPEPRQPFDLRYHQVCSDI